LKSPLCLLVRLKPLNQCPVFRLHTLNEYSLIIIEVRDFLVAPTAKPNGVASEEDGELSPAVRVCGSQQGKLPDNPVLGRTEVMAEFSDNETPIRVSLTQNLCPCDIPSRFLFSIDHDSVGFTLKEPLDRLVERIEVLNCTPDFESRALERVHTLDSTRQLASQSRKGNSAT